MTRLWIALLLLGALGAARAVDAEPVNDFRLLDHLGQSHQLYRQTDAKAVVLIWTGNGCPIARQSVGTIKALHDRFSDQKVVFWLINASPQDDRESIAQEAKEYGIHLPILKDETQLITRALGVTRTAEAICVRTEDWTVFYHGAIDNRLGYATQRSTAIDDYLADALESVLAGDPPARERTVARGCLIDFGREDNPERGTVSYSKQVAPLLQKHCVVCHSPGNIGPWSMSNYRKVKGWSSMIKEVVLTQRMPPWHADPHYGHFANDRSLATAEVRTLIDWIDQGSPRGEGPDPLLAEPPSEPVDWPLGKPDYVVSMGREIHVPDTGVFPYQYRVVESPIPEDAWLGAAVVKPGNRKVLHHCLIFLRYPKALEHLQPRHKGGVDGFFTGYVPGQRQVGFPKDTGKFVPKGSRFVFQLHYNATGKRETDQTEVGLYLLKEKPRHVLHTRAAANTGFEIPAGAAEHRVRAEFTFARDSLLYDLSPHMHFRGSSFEYDAVYPDGRREVLLSVPNYDFNWQTLYRLDDPKRMPAGTRLICRGSFDNSTQNPANPDPTKNIRWGDQTFDEMFIGYLNFAELADQ